MGTLGQIQTVEYPSLFTRMPSRLQEALKKNMLVYSHRSGRLVPINTLDGQGALNDQD